MGARGASRTLVSAVLASTVVEPHHGGSGVQVLQTVLAELGHGGWKHDARAQLMPGVGQASCLAVGNDERVAYLFEIHSDRPAAAEPICRKNVRRSAAPERGSGVIPLPPLLVQGLAARRLSR